jgi:ACS family glucarate transporter-like MFS transporter
MPQRYFIVGITAVAALWMYIDRVCVSTVAGDIQRDLGLSKWERAFALGAFFLTYALFQIPVGSLADRWGQRRVLTWCVLLWSVVTALTGFVNGFLSLLTVRLLLGVSEAGAYPAAAGLVKNWASESERGRFSSIVAAGGRVGNAISPFLTRWLAGILVGVGFAWWTTTPPDGQPPRNWRAVFVLYGICGVGVAVLFWLVVRDRPPASPLAPQPTPLPLPAGEPGPVPAATTFWQRIGILARSRNMWLFGGVQFCVNVSWAFLITKFPEYLERLKVPDDEIGVMQSVVLGIGATGMLAGGYVTDGLRKRLGPKLGRSLPIGVALIGCAAACAATVPLTDPWTIVIVLGLMAFLVDFGNPAIWSFAQDVGGKNVGAALGWGNMWGNLGAALSPILLTVVEDVAGWAALFVVCAGSFVGAAVCALLLDATRPVDASDNA